MRVGWNYKKLGEVCEIRGGATPLRTNDAFWTNGNIPWFTIDDIREQGKYITFTNQMITEAAKEKLFTFPKGTIMLCCTASLGACSIAKIELTSNQQFNGLMIKNREELLEEYLYYFATTLTPILLSLSGKATINFVSRAKVEKIEIPIPPLTTQQQIVSELDLLSHILDQKRQQLKEYDALAESIFYDMFGDESKFKKEKLVKLTTKIGSGATPKGGNQAYKDEGISLIRSLNVHNAEFKYEDLAHIDEEQAAALNNVTLEKNDVLFNITGASVTRCCIVPENVLPARVNQHVAILRSCTEVLNYIFLSHLLISSHYHDKLYALSRSNGATREAITKAQLENFVIPLPPLDLQHSFATKIESIEHQKQLLKESIKETEMLFQSRMDYWFNS